DAGLVAPGQVLTDEGTLALIFRPGLSTAEQVTTLSGRGVGMDVVKRNLEALGGSIAIRSDAGKGSTFRIKLPLTVAVLDAQPLAVAGQTFLLPLLAILETIRPAPGSVHSIGDGREVVMVRGQALPLLRLHRLLHIEADHADPTAGLVVIVEHEGRT